MNVTFYLRPDGRAVVETIEHIRPEDAEWFETHNVKVSMEDIGGQFAVYADIGREVDGEPDEVLVLSGKMNCEDTMSQLRKECEEAFV
jgi:hypothetical protein